MLFACGHEANHSESDGHSHAAVLVLVSVSHGTPHLTEYHGLLRDGSVGVRAAHVGPLFLAKDCGQANDIGQRDTVLLNALMESSRR